MIKPASAQQPEKRIPGSSEHKHHAASDISNISDISTVTCAICDASYMPSPAHEDLKCAPSVVLESALMSMCHFCFRCRRASCPACWDQVHSVCGSCVQEAGLPFRGEGTPLKGVAFSPVRQLDAAPTGRNTSSPMLVCVRPGRFQASNELPLAPEPPQTAAVVNVEEQLVEEHKEEDKPTIITYITARKSRASKKQVLQKLASKAKRRPASRQHFFRLVERMLTFILLIVLVAIMVLIVLAEVSATANTLIVRLLHVDIREEVAYLLYVIRQMHL